MYHHSIIDQSRPFAAYQAGSKTIIIPQIIEKKR